MQRILWMSVIVFGVIGVFGRIGDASTISVPSSEATQQVTGNGVTVTATLLKEKPDGTEVMLTLDTYFANLVRYDLGELTTLRDDTGKTYPVVAVEQIGSRKPHSRQAILRFAQFAPEARTIELVVRDVAGIKERTSRWNVTE